MGYWGSYWSSDYWAQGYWGSSGSTPGITVDWGNKIIYIPLSFMPETSLSRHSFSVNSFQEELAALYISEGSGYDPPQEYTPGVTLDVSYAGFVKIINDYTITFENGSYAAYLTGDNNNILDVANLNSVSIRSQNSGGLLGGSIDVSSIWEYILTTMPIGSAGEILIRTDISSQK